MSYLKEDTVSCNLDEPFGDEISVPRVTVIIPTYFDWTRLQKCLKALGKQSYPLDDFEIIIVNNAPENLPPEKFWLPVNCRLICERKPGSYAARNAALQIAKGEILAFTDSDCVPDPLWLEAGVARLDTGAELVAGKIELFFKTDKLTIVEVYEKAFAFDQEKYARAGGSATANMVTWAENFKKVGYFNDELMSGGDVEWGKRANEQGVSVVYAPEVVVLHPARSDIKAMLKKKRRVLGGEVKKDRSVYKSKYFLILIKGCFPPRAALSIFREKDLSFYEKCMAYLLSYYFKAYATIYRLALLSGLAKSERS